MCISVKTFCLWTLTLSREEWFNLTESQKYLVKEVYKANNNSNECIHWDMTGLLNLFHTSFVSERKWICGLISVIILQFWVKEDSIFFKAKQEINVILHAYLADMLPMMKIYIFIHILKNYSKHIPTCVDLSTVQEHSFYFYCYCVQYTWRNCKCNNPKHKGDTWIIGQICIT